MSDPSDFLEDPDPFEPETSPEELPPAKMEPKSFAASLIAEAAVRAEPRPAAPQPVADEPPPAAGLGIPAALPVVTDISTAEASPAPTEAAEAPEQPNASDAAAASEPADASQSAETAADAPGEVVPFPAERAASESPRAVRILAIANQKGGVGKTTTAINLGTALAAAGERVLVIDLDPQGNASTGLGIDRKNRALTTYDVLIGQASLRDTILPTAVARLSIAPSTIDLAGIELEIGPMRDRAFRLRDALTALAAELGADDAFTYVLVDCPPALNLLTVNAMAAAHAIIVPLQCEFFALEGLSQLLKTVDQVKTALNPALAIHGIVLTMYDKRNNLSDQVVDDVRQFMGSRVYNTVIPRNVRVSEAPSYGKPVLVYDLKCAGSEAYLRLAAEVIQREKDMTERLAG